MKDKILKLFFDEELVLIREDDKSDKDALYIVNEDDVNWIVRFFKYTNIFFLIHHISKIIIELVYPLEPYDLGLLHYSLAGLIIFLFVNTFVDYFYVKEMFKNSKNNFNLKLKDKIKRILISILVMAVFSIFNVVYGIIQIFSNKTIYYFITIATAVIFITSFILGIKIINYFFKQFDKLNEETDGIV